MAISTMDRCNFDALSLGELQNGSKDSCNMEEINIKTPIAAKALFMLAERVRRRFSDTSSLDLPDKLC